jgi:hypothetical protein
MFFNARANCPTSFTNINFITMQAFNFVYNVLIVATIWFFPDLQVSQLLEQFIVSFRAANLCDDDFPFRKWFLILFSPDRRTTARERRLNSSLI